MLLGPNTAYQLFSLAFFRQGITEESLSPKLCYCRNTLQYVQISSLPTVGTVFVDGGGRDRLAGRPYLKGRLFRSIALCCWSPKGEKTMTSLIPRLRRGHGLKHPQCLLSYVHTGYSREKSCSFLKGAAALKVQSPPFLLVALQQPNVGKSVLRAERWYRETHTKEGADRSLSSLQTKFSSLSPFRPLPPPPSPHPPERNDMSKGGKKRPR